MNAKRLTFAALAALALAATVFWLEIEQPRREAKRREAETRLLIDAASLTELNIRRGEAAYTMRPVGDGSWSLRSSTLEGELVADWRAINLLTKALLEARSETLMEEAPGPEALKDFGLEPERLRISWITSEGERSVLLGSGLPTDPDRGYGQIGSRLVALPRELARVSAWGLDHWRLKTLLLFSPDDLRRIEIERKRDLPPDVSARLVLGLDEHPKGAAGWWRVLEPVDAAAHPTRVSSLTSLLYRLQADSFVADHPGEVELGKAGLSPPRVVVRLHFLDGSERLLQLGDPRELSGEEIAAAGDRELLAPVHGRLDEGPIVLLRPDLLTATLQVDDAYRDNRALPLPLLRLVAFTHEKAGADGEPLVLELYREIEGPWRAARPRDAELPQDEVALLTASLQEVLFGRFEDEVAADPSGFEKAYDLSAPDTFWIEARALDVSGESYTLSIEAAPEGAILRGREIYRPVRITDRAGRRSVGVAKFRAFDEALDKISALRKLVEESEASQEKP